MLRMSSSATRIAADATHISEEVDQLWRCASDMRGLSFSGHDAANAQFIPLVASGGVAWRRAAPR